MEIKFKANDYIVCIPGKSNNSGSSDSYGGAGYLSNYCYKIQKAENYYNHQVLWKCNDGAGVFSYSARHATPEEIAQYDRLGKPYDVTTLKSKSLVGRYLKALLDEPNGTSYSKGEYILIIRDDNKGSVDCKKGYGFGQNEYNWKDSSVELMPEGFNPNVKESTPQFVVGKWYKLEANHLTSPWYIKYLSESDVSYNGEYIDDKRYGKGGSFDKSLGYNLIPINLSEIQEYLPDGHVDKITSKEEELWTPQVGDWVVIISGDSPESKKLADQCVKLKSKVGPFTNGWTTEGSDLGGVWYNDKKYKNEFRKALPHEIPAPSLKDSFVLPEKWCVKGGKDLENSTFRDWKGNPDGMHGDCDQFYHFNGEKIDNYSYKIEPGYTEITFDQFKEHVLNKPNEPVKASLSNRVEKAKRDYPIGSTFYDLVHFAPFVVASHDFDTFGNDSQLYVSVKPRPGFTNKTARLYKDGVWAQKVENSFKSRVKFKVGDEVIFITEKSHYYSKDGSVEKGTVRNKGKSFTIGEISTKHPDLIRFTYDKDIWYMEGDFKLKKSANSSYDNVTYNHVSDDRVTAIAIAAMQDESMNELKSLVGISKERMGQPIIFGTGGDFHEDKDVFSWDVNFPIDVKLKTKSITTKLNTHVDRTDVRMPEMKQKSKSIKF